MPGLSRSFEERFWSKVHILGPDDCWVWTAARLKRGYGVIGRGGRGQKGSRLAHRIAYELSNEPIPDGLLVCHRCDNPPCCNPSHLFIGTGKDNAQDALRKGLCYTPEYFNCEGRKAAYKKIQGEGHGMCRLTEGTVLQIRRLFQQGHRQADLMRQFGVSRVHIFQVIRNKRWKHLGMV